MTHRLPYAPNASAKSRSALVPSGGSEAVFDLIRRTRDLVGVWESTPQYQEADLFFVLYDSPPHGAPLLVMADAEKMMEIVGSLILNAFHWLSVAENRHSKPWARIILDSKRKTLSVEGNGPGIDLAQVATIFEAPVRAGRSREIVRPNLYVARKLALAQGCELQIVSPKGPSHNSTAFVLDLANIIAPADLADVPRGPSRQRPSPG